MVPVEDIHRLIKKLQIEPSSEMDRRVHNIITEAIKESGETNLVNAQSSIWRKIIKNPITKIAAAASFLVIASLAISFILYGKVIDLRNELDMARRDSATTVMDDSVTINFYLKEHQDTIARYASYDSTASQPLQMQINQDDILYYESFGNQSDFMNPGMIFRGSSFEREENLPEAPVIFNGHALTLSEARETSNFDLVAPPRLYPAHRLETIRRIEDRDALHLLYSDGINSVSLFEQPLDGQRGLSRHDFREYAVYRNTDQAGGTILAWRDDTRSYVLIGNTELSQLMDMAQSISARK